MIYRLYSKKEVQQGQSKSPSAQHNIEKILETKNIHEVLDEAISNHKIKNLHEADIRILDGGCEWHLSNQEILQRIEDYAEEHARKLIKSLEDQEPVRLECPSCGVQYVVPPYVHNSGKQFCGDCSDKDNNGPILQEVEE